MIRIDGKDTAKLEYYTATTFREIIYSSEYLPFGEHTIEVESFNDDKGNIFISSFIIDPLPNVGGYKLRYNDIHESEGEWIDHPNDNTSYFSSKDKNSYIIFKFHGTRFWLTGVRKLNFKRFKLIIDNGSPNMIDLSINFIKGNDVDQERFDNHRSYLLYESNVLEFKDHEIKIMNDETMTEENEVSIVNLLYSTQPYNGICIPSTDIKFDDHWEATTEGYKSYQEGSTAIITKYFNHIWIIGNKEEPQSNMNIYYNENEQRNINLNQIDSYFSKHILLYELKNILLNNYYFKLEQIYNIDTNPEEILHINYFYYLNDKDIEINQEVSIIESSQMHLLEGKWEQQNLDSNTKIFYLENEHSTITIKYLGSKFWIIGSLGPNYGIIDIKVDDRELENVSLYREKDINNIIYYESPNDVFYGR